MSFTAKDVQVLREKTGCGIMDCKKALSESQGDADKALELLREKGLAAASKKAARVAAEGIVYALVNQDKTKGVLIEVNSETDFVAKNEDFIKFVKTCAQTVLENNPSNVEVFLESTAVGSKEKVSDILRDKILTIGENIKIRRFIRYEGFVQTYIHGEGRIGVMVNFNVDKIIPDLTKFEELSKDIAMQIAATNPLFLSKESVPSDIINKEKEILTTQAINEGKPAAIAEKMVMGRIQKYFKEVCLLEQSFIKDPEMSVSKYLEKKSKELGSNISVKTFTRFEKGEGLEKREDNFANEVADMIK